MAIVYVGMTGDLLHHGHINILKQASRYGEVVVGLLTDKAVAGYKRLSALTYEERKIILENIKGVKEVIPQDSLDYVPNLELLKPSFVVHGDDWKEGIQNAVRARVIEALKEWNGTLIEIPYTKGVSSSRLQDYLRALGTTPQRRMQTLPRLLGVKKIVRFLEAHNGLSALIVDTIKIEKELKTEEFDGIWLSSLTDSTAKGKPDIELVDRLDTLHNILDVTVKPVIVDGDTGGVPDHFVFTVRTLERLGVSGIIIEDKIGLKKNSLFGTEVEQTQDAVDNFCYKISRGKKAQVTNDFMIIARIESLILKKGIADAIQRAKAYIEAGADGIMIHSKEKEPAEIFNFCSEYALFEKRVPLVVVPTTYNYTTEEELSARGVNLVIYANQLLRSAYPAMVKTAKTILHHERGKEADELCLPIKEIITLISSER